MRGIVLAGGSGSRLYPLTKAVSKQLLPVYDKPTLYYPISTLMLAGIREILIISTPRDLPMIKNLMGTGEELGVRFSYAVQEKPEGIAQAFLIGKEFIGDDPVCLILGDNLFYGEELTTQLLEASRMKSGAIVFGYHVQDPERYGVVEFEPISGRAISIEEKPKKPKSKWAVTGLYFYDNSIVKITEGLKPSKRGELEITDVNRTYLEQGKLQVKQLGRGVAWLDTGTYESLLSSSQFVQTLEQRQGLKIGCLEEVALLRGFIMRAEFEIIANKNSATPYGQYLLRLLEESK